jgi:hypothetical protein
MNINRHATRSKTLRSRLTRAITIVEMMITMFVFGLATMAWVYSYLYGLKVDELTQSKLGASDESRRSFEKVARDIRCASVQSVGNYSGTTFTPIVNGNLQSGNALQIKLVATNTNTITYYFDTNILGNWKLCRVHSAEPMTVIASNLQNSCNFTAEDFSGTAQSNMLDRMVIHFSLDFLEYQYPRTFVGSNYLYDRYVLDFRATPHVPGGK